MKKILLSIIVIVFYLNIFAQSDYYTTIKTPTNVSVEAIYRVEYSSDQLAQIEAQAADWISDYDSKAARVAPASKTYNCHDYAWHYSDGGTKRWVDQLNIYGNANLSKYWSGSSHTYQLTTSSNATKVFYSDGDHSAIIISSNVYESKWGAWPRYRHAPDDCPYITSNKQYYAVSVIGSGLICSSNTYSTLNISGASYNWSGNKVSISGNSSSVTATQTSKGSGWIKTKISSPYSGTTITTAKKTFWVGKPIFSIDGDKQLEVRMPGIAEIDYSSGGGGSTDVLWTRSGAIATITGGPVVAKFRAGSRPGMGEVYAKVTNTCGSKENRLLVDVTGGWYSIYPNPSNNVLYVKIDRSKLPNSLRNTREIHIKLYDNMMRLKKQRVMEGNQLSINVSDIQKGLYVMQLTTGKKTYEKKIIISRHCCPINIEIS